MSIINEALKKAETAKKPSSSAAKPETIFKPFRTPLGIKTAAPPKEEKAQLKPKVLAQAPSRSWKWNNIWWFVPPAVLLAALVVFWTWQPILELPTKTQTLPRQADTSVAAVSAESVKPPAEVSERETKEKAPASDILTQPRQPLINLRNIFSTDDKQFMLSGISNLGSFRTAIVNNKIVEEGDIIDGARVVSIADEEVNLQFRGKQFTLRLY